MFDHLRADQGVRFHDLEFFLGQLAGLVQDLLIDTDLADVVQGRGQRNQILLFCRNRVVVADLQ